MPLDARAANEAAEHAASPRGVGQWTQAHAGFVRAVLLILAYCSAVISMISIIAFGGIQTVTIVTGVTCILAVTAIFLLPRSRESSR